MFAYGFNFPDLAGSALLIPSEESDWPVIRVSQALGDVEVDPHEPFDVLAGIGTDHADWRLVDGTWISLDRRKRSARYVRHEPFERDDLVHPHLGPAAAMFARWDEREAFHAGAFVLEGGVWIVLGDKRAGKSTLLASLALAGYPVVADDIVVLDHLSVFGGPRCIDLREPSVRLLGLDGRVCASREGDRLRFELPQLEPTLPLAGWVFVNWAEETELRRLPASECLVRVSAARLTWKMGTDPQLLLELAALPAWEFRRPTSTELERVTSTLVAGISSA